MLNRRCCKEYNSCLTPSTTTMQVSNGRKLTIPNAQLLIYEISIQGKGDYTASCASEAVNQLKYKILLKT